MVEMPNAATRSVQPRRNDCPVRDRLRSFADAPQLLWNIEVPGDLSSFVRRRPAGWTLRQAAELVLLARVRDERNSQRIVANLLEQLAPTLRNLPPWQRQAARDAGGRLLAASQNCSWLPEARQLVSQLPSTGQGSAVPRTTREAIVATSAQRLRRYRQLARIEGFTQGEPVSTDQRLVPDPDLARDLLRLPSGTLRRAAIEDAPRGSSWRRWFPVRAKHRWKPTWFREPRNQPLAQQFVWNCIHDGTHIMQLQLMGAADGAVLGCGPRWASAEAMAMAAEHRAFEVLTGSGHSVLTDRMLALELDRGQVVGALLEGFIERERRWLRQLGHDVGPHADFDLTPTMPRIYAEGWRSAATSPRATLTRMGGSLGEPASWVAS